MSAIHYNEGYTSFQNRSIVEGLTVNPPCPYFVDSQAYTDWWTGYEQAEFDWLEEKEYEQSLALDYFIEIGGT